MRLEVVLRPGGEVRVELRASLGRVALDAAAVTVTPGTPQEVELDWLEDLAPIRGRVTDAHGEPVEGVLVRAFSDDRDASQRMTSATTDADGAFALDVAAGGRWDVSVSRGPVSDRASDVAAGTEGVELVLAGTGTLRLRLVVAETGAGPGAQRSRNRELTWSAGRFGDEGDEGALASRLVFLLAEDELGLVEGPFPESGGDVNHRINGRYMRVGAPHVMHRLLTIEAPGLQVVPGLRPGRYHLRVFSDDVALEPASFDLPPADVEPIEVRYGAD